MSTETQLLSMKMGRHTIAENLATAVAQKRVTLTPDGVYRLPEAELRDGMAGLVMPHINCLRGPQHPCTFLFDFLYPYAYNEAAVPFMCRNCYKVKIHTQTLRQLWAAKEIAESLPLSSKSGVEAENHRNQSLYGTYLYHCDSGLDAAKETYCHLRSLVDASPKLGSTVRITIKRGCTEMEQRLGPSNRYTFDPALEKVEAYLLSKFIIVYRTEFAEDILNRIKLMHMIRVAYQIGDNTYLDFTNGKPLYPDLIDYAPTTD